ncbi:MAG: DUF2207 domain-containing protein [Actinomycetota bacterium]|nr:DUF2207 domain-containing protein [Actinomycetota bacterium]
MLNPVGVLRHVVVGSSALALPVLALVGVVGGGIRGERFDAKQVLVVPTADGEGVRIRETVDQDFGTTDRHGLERFVPNDFGDPAEIEVFSPDAPDDVEVVDMGDETRIRVGDADTTISGQHRYVLTYTLPEARLSRGALALDIIGSEETLETGRFEVVLAGFQLEDPTCNIGAFGTEGGCQLLQDGDVYRVVFQPLGPGQGITIGGTIVALTPPADVPLPAPVARRADHRVPLALGATGLGAAAGLGGFLLARRLGRNEVGGAGAADAAYAAGGPSRLVSDDELDSLATTEFEPPRGLHPWQGALLLREKVDEASVSAWFSEQIAAGALEIRGTTSQVLATGPDIAKANKATQQRITALVGADGTLRLGEYAPTLDALWRKLHKEQSTVAGKSGWWTKFAPGTTPKFPAAVAVTVGFAALALALATWAGWLRLWPLALLAGFTVPAVVAGIAYRPLLPVRSAEGSALALRTESFRRFLEASEGQHVEWAWQRGLLREYSAWAVALGAADAWGRAVAASAVPPTVVAAQAAPLLLHTYRGNWQGSVTKPSSSSSGGGGGFSGGGFSGGSVGGGGGGGSSGSW